jgi:hypothetical protein
MWARSEIAVLTLRRRPSEAGAGQSSATDDAA